MKKIATLVAVLAVLLVTACTKIPDAGIVTAHDYNYPWMQMICSGYNAQGVCTMQVPIYHDAQWNILVDPNTQKDGDAVWVTYSQDVFETYPIGSVWRNPNPED